MPLTLASSQSSALAEPATEPAPERLGDAGFDRPVAACRLLVLDDDPVFALTLQLMSELAGAEVCVTMEPALFFERMESWQPSHVCTDLDMPELDGMQVLAELARRGCAAQVIICSGVADRVLASAARSAIEHGLQVAGVLPKPFTLAMLRRLLAPRAGAEFEDAGASLVAQGGLPTAAPPARSTPYMPDLPALEHALKQHHLCVVYQPKVRCATGQLCGLEALVRWEHPQHGIVGPDQFIPLAERAGRIDELTLQVLDQALAWFVPWRLEDPTRVALTLSINLSARSLGSPYLVASIHERCTQVGLNPAHLIFELTETAAMDDPALALELLTRMRVQGFQLSIDDFGTGFSSMLQLVRLPFTEIKVDRSFVMSAVESAESRAVIRSIVDLGHSLGLRITAEGVEDAGALAYLRMLGCDEAQGYFIARPLTPAQLENWAGSRPAPGEAERLQALQALNLLNTPPEPRFDRLTSLARTAFRVPMAMVNLVAEQLLWTKSVDGFEVVDVPPERSICVHVIQGDEPFVVTDLSTDPRFEDHPLIGSPMGLRFYAGCPLQVEHGPMVGVLCVLDTQARPFDARDRELLLGLAKLAEIELAADRHAILDAGTGLLNARAFEQRAAASLSWAVSAGMAASLVLIEPPASTRNSVAALLQHAFGAAALVASYRSGRLIVLCIGLDHAALAADEAIAWLEAGVSKSLGSGRPAATRPLRWGRAHAMSGGHFGFQNLLMLADAALNEREALGPVAAA